MRCAFCSKNPVFQRRCKEHFTSYFESKVKSTIKRFRLLHKKEKVAVAVSGGKDSLSLLYLLHKFRYDVTALAIDEGISNYREKTLYTLKQFCIEKNIPLQIYSFESEIGKSLDKIVLKGERPCTACGILRRYLLNKAGQGFSVIATGHNMDDEAQAVLMNLMKNSTSLLERQGPVSGAGKHAKFAKRVKPFYFCTEKEIMVYSFINRLVTKFAECPYVSVSFRLRLRDCLNSIEADYPGTKRNIINWFLAYKRKKRSKGNPNCCISCGEPSSKKICNACLLIERLNA